MDHSNVMNYIKDVIANMPAGWLGITTHRLDIYNEELAKTEFLDDLEILYTNHNSQTSALDKLPTAYDYIRLGHPLSCVLEWGIAKLNDLDAENVISFSSMTMPILAILRKNSLENRKTRILHFGNLPENFNAEVLKTVYQYNFDLQKIDDSTEVSAFDGSTILVSQDEGFSKSNFTSNIDFLVNLHKDLGSVLLVSDDKNSSYISDIQHVRRRETIAMTPADALQAIKIMVGDSSTKAKESNNVANKKKVEGHINEITGTTTKSLIASSGLSIQYAIMMGLVDNASEIYPGKKIKFIVPPNCYGGTNDQARRVAACLDNVDIVDLPVDGDNDMVQSIDKVLKIIANENAVPYIIAEIPTNPRVEVPDLLNLKKVLTASRETPEGDTAIEPVFILDQTFCPNVHFLGEGEILSSVRTISFASGSKFPSGGQCTAGYCVGNKKTNDLISKIEKHLHLCDNEATDLQYAILAKQLPSMNQRIADAYTNTREFVDFIHEVLPDAKINFVTEELADKGFTPSVFSLDLPTKGENAIEKEAYKRKLNLKLINLMITEIPEESKFCVSYGQLKGCYWTIPATSTQGTTKEGDKDYIVRASLSPDLDLEKHKQVFKEFVQNI